MPLEALLIADAPKLICLPFLEDELVEVDEITT